MTEDQVRTKILEFIKGAETVNLADAEIIVSGGRGVGGPENFKVIRELAEVLGAAVGASRAAVDSGWIPYEHQVGQTGRTVQAQDLYCLWYLRFHSTSGRDEDIGYHCRHQQRS